MGLAVAGGYFFAFGLLNVGEFFSPTSAFHSTENEELDENIYGSKREKPDMNVNGLKRGKPDMNVNGLKREKFDVIVDIYSIYHKF